MSKKRIIITIGILLTIGFIPSTSTKAITFQIQQDTLSIVTSLSIVADFTSQITEGLIEVQNIVTGTENPHIYEPTPSEIESVVNADLFIQLGLDDLEPWVEALLLANPTIPVLTLVDSSMIEYDPVIKADNPHVWLDPNKVQEMIEEIYNEVSSLDSVNNATYYSNYLDYNSQLNTLLSDINNAKTEFSGLNLVEHHPAFMYFFNLLGINRIAAIEEHEGEEPSAEHIAEVIQAIEDNNVTMIINQPQLEEEEIIEIARDTGIQIAELSPLLGIYDEKGLHLPIGTLIDNYLDLMYFNLEALRNPYSPLRILFNWEWWFLVSLGSGSIITTLVIVVIVRSKNKPIKKEY